MRRTFFAFAIVVLTAGLWLHSSASTPPNLIGNDDTVRLPLTWALEAETSLETLHAGEITDPLIFGMNVVAALAGPSVQADDEAVAMIAEHFDAFMDRRNGRGYWHHAAYGDFPEGWYSGMDFASMALAALALHQSRKDQRFLDTSRDLMAQMILPVAEGGVNHQTSRAECWLGEYVWPGMGEEGQDFVLNGALLALLALEIHVSLAPEDGDLRSARDCTLASLMALMPAYFYGDGSWSRYKLNPAAPQMAHYQIYEINEFDALHKVTGDSFYRRQADLRRDMMAGNFKVWRDGERYLFSQLGAPHPFVPDIYGTRIVFRDGMGAVVGEAASDQLKGKERLLMTGPLPRSARKVDVYAYSGSSEILLFANRQIAHSASEDARALDFVAEPALDLVPDGECTMIEPDRMIAPDDPVYRQNWQGRLYLSFDPVRLEELDIFTIDATVPAGLTWSMGLHLADGRELHRYLDRRKTDERAHVPLSRLGFVPPGSADDMVESATIYLETDGMEVPEPFCLHGVTVYPDYFAFGQFARRNFDALHLRLD